ncbi:MAG: M1 family metallopeptidase [Saprospiraceae bacterium]|nr:M1 family metallopeptidase [Saprospiraceae bacterium]MDW8484924.1 M1 family metallopeptidase [Saprospiraceae bacterium]
MKRLLYFASWLFGLLSVNAQVFYFQQEVNYQIRVTLDDTLHTLRGEVRMEYINHSPDTLKEIWLHLWPNAYRDRRTAFCRQKLRLGDAKFYFAPDSSLGYIRQLDFRVNGRSVQWEYHPTHADIAYLFLPEALPPKGKVVIETPFFVKLPNVFSRMGHEWQSYHITQWYPKPVVYDFYGLHPMPYLELGEFYSEFGSFEVEITLPSNYVVAATGVLESPEEREFLLRRVAETEAELAEWTEEGVKATQRHGAANVDAYPPSSPTMKTVRFRAERVHDFAWFADKRFRVLREVAQLKSGQQVECWAMFLPSQRMLWRQAAFYVRRAIEFYSREVGEYPWPQATAVYGAVGAGGGMEYPMIAVIGKVREAESLDRVIAHEVGHNWFYGILASNERDYAWMDEGINTYYEQRYLKEYYGRTSFFSELGEKVYEPIFLSSMPELLLTSLTRLGDQQTPSQSIDEFSAVGYYANAYVKPAFLLRWLEGYAGRGLFDRAMQRYYRDWQFRHPYPENLQAAWEEEGLRANWFFEAMSSAHPFDIAISKVRHLSDGRWEMRVKNRGALRGPFEVGAFHRGKLVHAQWHAPFQGDSKTIILPAIQADAFVLDHRHMTTDVFRSNNYWYAGNLIPRLRPPVWRPTFSPEAANRIVFSCFPWFAWNQYDKTIIGLALCSPILPPQRLRYYFMPGIGIVSKNVVGVADVQYRFLPGGFVPHATLGLSVRSATYGHRLGNSGYRLQYWRWSPILRLDLRSTSPVFTHGLEMRALFLQKEEPTFNDQGVFAGKSRPSAWIYESRYEMQNLSMPNPFRALLAVEGQRYSVQGKPASYIRASIEWQQEIYYRPKRRIYARFFGGYFLHNTQRRRGSVATNNLNGDVARASFALNPQGFNDYRFDQIFLGRSETRGFLARQVSQTEGGFKNAFGLAYAQVFGNSNDFVIALNLRADLPMPLPIKPYFDLGYFRDATPLGTSRPLDEQLAWSGGLMLEILRGRFEVYFPLLNSALLRQLYQSATDTYWQCITWSLRLTPIRARDREQIFQMFN